MKIESVLVSNWRSIKYLEFKFQSLMILIGQNNHGKSNILSALLFFFGEIKHQDLDFNKGSTELFVEITFSHLDDDDKTTFKKYLTADGKVKVRKTAYLDGNFEYRGYLENPVDEWLRESNASLYTKRELVETLPIKPFIANASGRLLKQDIVDAQNAYMQANLDSISFNYELEETNFLGLKSVAKGIFGNVFFIPAVKDSIEDFSTKDSSAFGKLYSKMIESMSHHNDDWKSTKERLSKLFGALNETDSEGMENHNRPSELVDFETALSEELEGWGAKISVEVTPPNIDDVFKANTQVWVNDGVRTDIKRKGHGLQRALIFALIKVVSKGLKANTETEDSETSPRKTSASNYFILEEPELYLHPQAQRSMFDSLVALSESANQVILCTHSSSLISVDRYESIAIVKKESEDLGTKVSQCSEDLFSGNKKKDLNLTYWINPDRSELFFAKRVVLVEGQTDKIVIPLLAKRMGIFRHDHTLVDCGSKSNIPLYCMLLNKFKIPYVAVYDLDHQESKLADSIANADKASADIKDIIDIEIGSSVVFENDIEEEIGFLATKEAKAYEALVKVGTEGYEIPEKLADKIRSIYSS